MDSVARRTRSCWDEYYRNRYNELKRKDQETGGVGRRDKRARNVVDSECIVVTGDGGKSGEKCGFVITGEKRVGGENTEHGGSSERRRGNAVKGFAVSRNVAGKRAEVGKDDNVVSVGKRKLDMRAKIDGDVVLMSDDDVELLGEQVVLNDLCLKTEPESRSGSALKVGNLDEVVSSIRKEVWNEEVETESGGSSGQHGRGKPQIKPLDGKQMCHDISVDLENSIGSGNSIDCSGGSDNSVDSHLSESESTGEEDDEFFDEDYKGDESSNSESSSSRGGDAEPEKGDEYENLEKEEEENLSNAVEDKGTLCHHSKRTRMDVKKESDTEQEKENESAKGYSVDDCRSSHCNISSNQQKLEGMVIMINENEFSSVRKGTRMNMKKETEVELERDDEIDEGYHAIYNGRSSNKTSANWKKEEDVVIIIDDKENFPSMSSARIDQREDSELDGSTRIFKPCTNYGCVDKARKDRVAFGSLTARNVRKQVKDNPDEIGLKKRDALGLEFLVDCDKSNDKEERSLAKCLQPGIVSQSQSKEPELGTYSSPVAIESASSTDDEHQSFRDKCSCHIERVVNLDRRCSEKKVKLGKKKSGAARNLDMIKILVESINAIKEKQCPIEENALAHNTLPLRFRFEDEVVPPPKKSEWEILMDSLFCDLELGLRESEIDCTSSSVMENEDLNSTEINETPAARCGRGEHEPILDEQIGIVCKFCAAVILDIKYVMPEFYTPPLGRQDRKDSDESPSSFIGQIQLPSSVCKTPDSTTCARGTVWDLIPGVEKEMYPHQREGFEFIWKNIAGEITIEKLKKPLSEGRGCIISHAPGTGKTRLTIVFLQTFLKLYPSCCPVIVAPRGMLLTWESEFIKWNVHIPFHNINRKELSGNENAVATKVFGQVGTGKLSKDCIRLMKLYSWMRGGSILGISYKLFGTLAGKKRKGGLHGQIRKVFLECPGLLVLDEGHNPRNNRSQIWKALTKVATQHRIILSGTPFQNNLTELYNTLCLVNPKFVNQIGFENITSCKTGQRDSMARKRWTTLTSSIGKNRDDEKKLRAMLDPFVHVHKGTIKESLPGLRHTLVFLHPTECQKTLLETSSKARSIFRRIRLVSLISVHPSLTAKMRMYSAYRTKLEEIESDVDAGVKTKFLLKLVWLADALDERVLVFSQFIDPLVFIQKQIESHFSWNEGRELLYMDGNLDEKQRQDSISSLNDDTSEAKVLLASTRACSEGINLIGASRVVMLDTVWNPSVEKQAISRAYRLGQKKVVYVYRLITSGMEVRQYAQQIKKERISQLIFSPGDGHTCQNEKSAMVLEDKILEAMLNLERFSHIFEKIIYEPKESDLFGIFGLEEQN